MERIFEDVISEYKDKNLKIKKDKLYKAMKVCNLDFSKNIGFITIKKSNKKRRVLYPESRSLEEIVLKYLKRRLDSTFNIIYPDRKRIMKECFSIIEALIKMTDFVIFNFDLKNFFESVSSDLIFEKYIKNSTLYRYEKDILKKLVGTYKQCFAGIPTSNAFIEIITTEFDTKVKSKLNDNGLIFYSRYVDDILLIFNNKVSKSYLVNVIETTIEEIFQSSNVKMHPTKRGYFSKSDTRKHFTYLGYKFHWTGKKFMYGICPKKIGKYRKRLKGIALKYSDDRNIELLRQRLLFFSSRVVFYNNLGSKYSKKANWDVIGLTSSYNELRHFISKDKIIKETKSFLVHGVENIMKRELKELPYFLKGKNNSSYQLYHRLKNNKSIVFHPNIGWTQKHLYKQIIKISPVNINKKKSYRELVKIYCNLMKYKES